LGLQRGVGTSACRHSRRSCYRGSDFGFDGSFLVEKESRNASQKGVVPKDDKFKHQDRKESREASEAGGGNRAKKGGQEQKIKTVKVSQRGDIPGAARVSILMFVLPADRPHGEPAQNTKSIIESLFWSAVISGLLLAVGCSAERLDVRLHTAELGKSLPDNIVHIAGR